MPVFPKGWKVFPVQGRSDAKPKHPYPGFLWSDAASDDPDKIAAWETQFPGCGWAVHCGKSGICAIDLDTKKINGVENWAKLEEQHGNSNTLVHRTPSRGFHVIFRGHLPSNRVGALGGGIDIRTGNGYIVIPPAEGYKVVSPNDPAPVPQWLFDLLNTAPVEAPTLSASVSLDDPQSLARAKAYLIDSAPAADHGSRDHTCYAVACQLRDFGVSREESEQLMVEHYSDKVSFSEDFSMDDMLRTVRSAWKYASSKEPGTKSLEAMFGPAVDVDPFAAPKKILLPFKNLSELNPKATPKMQWVLEKRLCKKYGTLLIGPSAASKSTYLLAELLAVASGEKLTGLNVIRRSRVGYINLEDDQDHLDRQMEGALKNAKARGFDIPEGLFGKWMWYFSARSKPLFPDRPKEPMYFLKAAEQGRGYVVQEDVIRATIDTIQALDLGVVCFDPIVRLGFGIDENDNMAMDLLARQFARIMDETGCAISLGHHVNKAGSGERGNVNAARGASALNCAVRITHTMMPMNEKEAKDLKIRPDQMGFYTRIDLGKTNIGSPGGKQHTWLERGQEQIESGGHVGVLTPVDKIGAEAAPDEPQEVKEEKLMKAMFDFIGPSASPQSLSSLAAKIEGLPNSEYGKGEVRAILETMFADRLPKVFQNLRFVPDFKPSRGVLVQISKYENPLE